MRAAQSTPSCFPVAKQDPGCRRVAGVFLGLRPNCVLVFISLAMQIMHIPADILRQARTDEKEIDHTARKSITLLCEEWHAFLAGSQSPDLLVSTMFRNEKKID
ncbi:hypothetical protein [Craterilacuibacter sp. RT1T]|uniref:hypothetical protein n=1 Tax=Craterilacuibacter sp. RT1T TaxID=2942211 RepID=UPI0020BEC631|nr:hypothetical protein [Craterilacuibacter sp. RT1T]MCL6262212.1 hypothetical protein [Craterilacuibacter sp. RT1T]